MQQPLKKKLYLLAAAILGAGVVNWILAPKPDPLDNFPHTFIEQAGYDPALISVVYAPLSQPPPAPPGMAPAWVCEVAPFVDQQGRPWQFPLAAAHDREPIPPVHPELHISPPFRSCKRLQTPEGEHLLEVFKKGLQP